MLKFRSYSAVVKMCLGFRLSVSLLIILEILIGALGFNLEVRLPIVKTGDKDSYFGYSVATHIIGETVRPDNEKWLLVGAPLGQNYQPHTNHSGALYKCPITQKSDDCEQVITDGRRLPGRGVYEPSFDNDRVEELHPPMSEQEIKNDQWLGVTVQSQGLGGKVLVCAHRYITKISEAQYGQGLCYVLANNLEFDEVYEPCKGRSVQRQHEDYGFCQAGTSGALLEDNTMVIGTPGPFTWRGTIFVTEIGGEYLQRDKNMYYGDHSEISSPVDKYSYLGMAVTGGRYFGQDMYYAAGAPRSNGHGQVVIFRKSKSNPIPVQKIIEGEQFASSFGYVLITADVNGDQKPDLLISAPFYFTKNEGGAVYIYQNKADDLPDKETLKLTGTLESRFGLALANIGDINKDLCEDIAIGAPYEGNGVVYIYLGNRQGLSSKPSQVIAASDLGSGRYPIKTFGSSIVGGTDLDGNSYPDVVIGAYSSSTVVALLSRPIINIRTNVRDAELKNIDPNKAGCQTDLTTNLTCFSFEACCAIDPYDNSPLKDFRLKYTIEAEGFGNNKKSRVFFDTDNKPNNVVKRSISVKTNGIPACTQETAYLKENTHDIQSPIKFRLNYTIVETRLPTSGLKYLSPILDKTEADKTFLGTFQKDCGSDDICESRLELVADLSLKREYNSYSLVLGEIDELTLNITITNFADSAYEAQLFIVHQASVTYIAANKYNTVPCSQFNETVISCNLGNPMKRDIYSAIAIRFDPGALDDSETELFFNIFANTTSKLLGDPPNKKLNVNIIKRAAISLNGWVTPQQTFYGGEIKGESAMQYIEDIGNPVTHTYQIYNDGPWKAYIVLIDILWPYQVANDKKQGKWLLYLESLPVIEGIRNGKCFVDTEYINPLKLPKRSTLNLGYVESPPESYMMRAQSNKSQSYISQEKTSVIKTTTTTNNEAHLNRVRRDRAKIIRAERFTDKDGKKTDIVNMDCEKGSASCIPIHCELYNMPKKAEVLIHIKSRLWNSTLVGDYPRVDIVKIVSRATVKPAHDSELKNMEEIKDYAIETKVYPELLDQTRDSSTPIWVIILAVLGGLIVLALLAALMWKCGFFKRRRPDPTLSGNIEKNSENKPLCQNTEKL